VRHGSNGIGLGWFVRYPSLYRAPPEVPRLLAVHCPKFEIAYRLNTFITVSPRAICQNGKKPAHCCYRLMCMEEKLL